MVNREKPKAKLRSIISKRRYYPKKVLHYSFNFAIEICCMFCHRYQAERRELFATKQLSQKAKEQLLRENPINQHVDND